MSSFSFQNWIYFWFLSISSCRNLRSKLEKVHVRIFMRRWIFLVTSFLFAMFSHCDFSMMKWSKIKSKPIFRKRKSISFSCNKNQWNRLSNEGATLILQTLAKTNSYCTKCMFLFKNGPDLILPLTCHKLSSRLIVYAKLDQVCEMIRDKISKYTPQRWISLPGIQDTVLQI